MSEKFKYIVDNGYIKNTYGFDYKANLATTSNIETELKQNYTRLLSYVTSHNVFISRANSSNKSYDIDQYNKDATNPLDAFYNQFLDDDLIEDEYKIDMWKQVQAIQAMYELDNGFTEFMPDKEQNRICTEAIEILCNSLNLLWRTEWHKG